MIPANIQKMINELKEAYNILFFEDAEGGKKYIRPATFDSKLDSLIESVLAEERKQSQDVEADGIEFCGKCGRKIEI